MFTDRPIDPDDVECAVCSRYGEAHLFTVTDDGSVCYICEGDT